MGQRTLLPDVVEVVLDQLRRAELLSGLPSAIRPDSDSTVGIAAQRDRGAEEAWAPHQRLLNESARAAVPRETTTEPAVEKSERELPCFPCTATSA